MPRFPLFIVSYDVLGEPLDVEGVSNEADGYKSADTWIEDLPAVHHVTLWKASKDGFQQVNTLTRVDSK